MSWIITEKRNLMVYIFSFMIERHEVNSTFKLLSTNQAVMVSADDATLNMIPRRKQKMEIKQSLDLVEFSKHF